MRKFLIKILWFSILVIVVNLCLGQLFKFEDKHLAKKKVFYPPLRWDEFYQLPHNSIDVLFLGASQCYRSFIPETFDSLTNVNSFNLGSSTQTVSTSYFVLKECLRYQKPKTVYLTLFSTTLMYEDQVKNVGYNFDNMEFSQNKLAMFLQALKFKEQVAFIFPVYRKREQLDRIIKYTVKPINYNEIDELYDKKGYVKSVEKISETALNNDESVKRFNWRTTNRTASHFHFLFEIIELCKGENIELVFLFAPVPSITYNKINIYEFEDTLIGISEKYNLEYLNLNAINMYLVDTIHYKDHHLNHSGASLATSFLAKYFNDSHNN